MSDADVSADVNADASGSSDGRLVRLVGAGLLVGLVAGSLFAWAMRDSPPAGDPVPPLAGDTAPEWSAADAGDFVAAWERSRTETYLAISSWRRVTAAGDEMSRVRVVAQRPPDRVLSSGRSLSGTVDGVTVQCDELVDDPGAESGEPDEAEVACSEVDGGFTAEDFQALVDEEVSAMWAYVEGDSPLYRVSRDGDCYDLRLLRSMIAPPYGQRARFCFDSETGASTEIQVERPEATDTLELLSVTAEVTDDDLAALAAGTYTPPER